MITIFITYLCACALLIVGIAIGLAFQQSRIAKLVRRLKVNQERNRHEALMAQLDGWNRGVKFRKSEGQPRWATTKK